MLEIGQHVVCINGTFSVAVATLYTALPAKVGKYVIRDIRIGIQPDCKTGDVSVLLVGLVNPKADSHLALERGFQAGRFQPLDETTITQSEPASDVIRHQVPVKVSHA